MIVNATDLLPPPISNESNTVTSPMRESAARAVAIRRSTGDFDSTINATGNLNYGKEELEYNINIIINFILDKIHNISSLINPYKPYR